MIKLHSPAFKPGDLVLFVRIPGVVVLGKVSRAFFYPKSSRTTEWRYEIDGEWHPQSTRGGTLRQFSDADLVHYNVTGPAGIKFEIDLDL